MTYAETDLVATIERLAGGDLAAMSQPQGDQLDQFHSGGTEAVDRLLPSLRLEPGMTEIDVGSGLGGQARQIARTTGAAVFGSHIASAYVGEPRPSRRRRARRPRSPSSAATSLPSSAPTSTPPTRAWPKGSSMTLDTGALRAAVVTSHTTRTPNKSPVRFAHSSAR